MLDRVTTRLLACLLLLGVTACGSSSKSGSDTVVTNDTSNGTDTTGGTDTTTPTFKFEEHIGTTWRATELIADQPKNSATIINTVWASDIRWCEETGQICCNHPSNTTTPITLSSEDCTTTGGTLVAKEGCAPALKFSIMVKLMSIDGNKLLLRAGSGDIPKLIESGKATWYTVDLTDPNNLIPPADIETTVSGTEFTTSLESALYFPSSAVNKPIPVRKLTVNGKFVYVDDVRPVDGCRPSGSKPIPGWIIEGTLSGVITDYEAEDLVTSLIPGQSKTLKWVLDNFSDKPTEDIDGDGTLDAYRFTGTFKARMITNFADSVP